ncbi:LexA family protein [Bacillus sp. Hm123]|uniref:LexA family protein n=1 Tax=Bacillus sp. Hm123 TaxID=3450745 RepID=UPI003F4305FF
MKSQREIFSENLQRVLNERKVDQRVLADHLQVTEASVSQWVQGKKYPRIDKIQRMADFLNVSKSELIEEITSVPANLKFSSPKLVKIPILGTIACGDPILAEENFKGWRHESEEFVPIGNVAYLECQGNSMEPTIPDGSLVLIREQPDVENGEIAAVLVNGDTEATLKRVKKQDGMVILMPDNPSHQPYIITESNPARIIGKAMKFTQDL